MASDFTIKWKGDDVAKKVIELTKDKMQDFVEEITEIAKENSPYETGHNRSSITNDIQGDGFRVYTQSGYGGYLELGTAKMEAQPYIFPAYEKAKNGFFKDLEDSV